MKIALAMMDGLGSSAINAEQLDRLARLGTIVDRQPLSDLTDDRARAVLAEVDVLFGHWGCPTLTAAALEAAPKLELFAYGAGTVKWQVTDAVWERGIRVTSAAAANAVPVAEYTVAMILLANKGALLFRERTRDPNLRLPFPNPLGNVAKRVGIVGASFVGRLVIDLLRPYALDIVVYDPYLTDVDAEALGVDVERDLTRLCATVDVLSVHAPDIPQTRGMIGSEQIAALRDGAVFINTARPALIDHDALTEHLTVGRLSAILDVTDPEPIPADHPLLALPNVFVTPHIAGSIGSELSRMADLAIDEIERFRFGRPLQYEVTRADLDRIA